MFLPEAKSLVLIADDPDAPSGLFTHWLVWNIPPQTNSIAEGSAPKGVHGTNDFGKSGYSGPCPPPGTHRYSFKIFALDRELDLRSGAKRSQVDAAMKGHVIAQGEFVGRYAREKVARASGLRGTARSQAGRMRYHGVPSNKRVPCVSLNS